MFSNARFVWFNLYITLMSFVYFTVFVVLYPLDQAVIGTTIIYLICLSLWNMKEEA